MRKSHLIVLIIPILLLALPNQFSFQGRLTDDGGFPAEGSYPVEFKLYNEATGGSHLWSENHELDFSGGLFNVIIGTTSEIPTNFFDNDSLYLETIIDGEVLTPRRRIVPQPYAIRAHYADSAGIMNLDTLGAFLDTTFTQAKLKISGESWIEDSIVFIEGSNIDLTQSGNNITINSTASGESQWLRDGSNIYPEITDNVGIGTISPLVKLHVEGSTILNGLLILPDLPTVESSDTMLVYDSGNVYKSPIILGDGRWEIVDSVLMTDNALGIARGGSGNSLLGDNKFTHVNFGTSSITGNESGASNCSVLGGHGNEASSDHAIIAGGVDNLANGYSSVIVGGSGNQSTDEYSFIGGGVNNRAIHRYAFVGGGYENHADYLWATIVGGDRNQALWDHTFIGGGELNTVDAEGATITGGRHNHISGDLGTIAGGYADTIYAHLGTIGGGFSNQAGDSLADSAATVAGGLDNEAEGKFSTVAGGYKNHAKGDRSCIPGGSFLRVGERSFGFRGGLSGNPTTMIDVSGRDETFHVVDANFYFNYTNTTADFIIDGSTDDLLHCDGLLNRVAVNSDITHGYKFYVNGGAAKPGDATWSVYSDRRLKKNITPYKRGLNEIIMIEPVNYEYNGKNNIDVDNQFTGIIAQDLKQIMPEATTMTESGYMAVRTDPIIWAMVNAIKELEAQNRQLQQRIELLESKNK